MHTRTDDAKLTAKPPAEKSKPLHRLAEVRQCQGLSRHSVAKQLGMTLAQVRAEENETRDLKLSRLHLWQETLGVPITELLVEPNEDFSPAICFRGQLVRVMRTALSIQELGDSDRLERLAENLIDQLAEIMPELQHLGPWHSVGQRRRSDELGVSSQRRISPEVFMDLVD